MPCGDQGKERTIRFTLDVDVPVEMSDGTRLMTNVWRPDVDRPVPVLLVRNPYGKDNSELYVSPNFFAFLEAGYALAFQDCRGTSRSEGAFVPHRYDAQDGAETIEWLAQQPWCGGVVGMYSGSYMGFVQWQAAATGVAPLKAIAPMITSMDFYRAPWFSPGGAFSLGTMAEWSLGMAVAECTRRVSSGCGDLSDLLTLVEWMGDEDWLRSTPIADRPLMFKYVPWLADVFEHPSRDEFWQDVPSAHVDQIATPALSVTGWYDLFIGESLAAYEAMQHKGAPGARGNQRLVIGPWSHLVRTGVFPDRRFGVTAMQNATQIAALHIAFFDRWLRGNENALDGHAPVQIFVMGIDQWRNEEAWPLPDAQYVDYHLDGHGSANTANGDGALSVTPATGDATDRYLYDPRRPVPTLGGHVLNMLGMSGPADQSPVEMRDDVLVYSTPILEQPVEVTGPVSINLHVSSSAVDTDFTAKLVDVFPDGRAILLCEGVQRMRYRDSLAEPMLMTPGDVYEIAIDMTATSNVFLPGHQIRLEISSSNFPRYDRNTNTGGNILHEREEDMVPAMNVVHHGPRHPSRLVLPIIDRRR